MDGWLFLLEWVLRVDWECSLVTWILISLPPKKQFLIKKKKTEYKASHGMMGIYAADWGVTWGVLAVVLVQFDQNWRRHHQEVTQRHGDRVRHHRKALAQTTQALVKRR